MVKPTDAEKRAHAKTCTFAERYGITNNNFLIQSAMAEEWTRQSVAHLLLNGFVEVAPGIFYNKTTKESVAL